MTNPERMSKAKINFHYLKMSVTTILFPADFGHNHIVFLPFYNLLRPHKSQVNIPKYYYYGFPKGYCMAELLEHFIAILVLVKVSSIHPIFPGLFENSLTMFKESRKCVQVELF